MRSSKAISAKYCFSAIFSRPPTNSFILRSILTASCVVPLARRRSFKAFSNRESIHSPLSQVFCASVPGRRYTDPRPGRAISRRLNQDLSVGSASSGSGDFSRMALMLNRVITPAVAPRQFYESNDCSTTVNGLTSVCKLIDFLIMLGPDHGRIFCSEVLGLPAVLPGSSLHASYTVNSC